MLSLLPSAVSEALVVGVLASREEEEEASASRLVAAPPPNNVSGDHAVVLVDAAGWLTPSELAAALAQERTQMQKELEPDSP